jgi:hypothetical protein
MAKLFYTLEEAARKLGKSQEEVMGMAKAGQLQELRDKDQVLFRRSAIDQLAGDGDMGSEINLEGLDLSASGGSSLQLGGSDAGGMNDLRLDDSAAMPASDLRLGDDELRLGDDDLRLDDAPAAPIAASGADDSMSLDDLTLADDEPVAPARPAAPAPRAPAPAPRSSAGSAAGSASGMAAGSGIGLADSSAGSMMMSAQGGGNDDSMALGGQTQLEAVGSGSGLLDISSEESFFGAQMIEESMGGDDAASIPENAADIFGGGETAAAEEVAPVTAGTSAVTFGAPTLAEARDPKFSGFTAGAMLVAAVALVGMGWSVAEMMVGNYTDVARMIAENWMYVLGGVVGGILVFGGVGLGIGKATA